MTNPSNPPRQWQLMSRAGRLNNGRIWRLHLPVASTTALTHDQAQTVVRCYVDPAHLAATAHAAGRSPGEVLADLLPTKAHLKSGDFGEMLTFTDLPARAPFPKFPLYRWRMRATRNDTVRGVDLLGVALSGAEPAADDVLLLCEVKTRAKTKTKTVVKEAYQGVMRDYTTRLAEQLLFQHVLLQGQGDHAASAALSRFFGRDVLPFRTQLIAAVVHDSTLWDDAFLDELPPVHPVKADVEVHVTCVDDLALWIDAVQSAAVSTCDPLCS